MVDQISNVQDPSPTTDIHICGYLRISSGRCREHSPPVLDVARVWAVGHCQWVEHGDGLVEGVMSMAIRVRVEDNSDAGLSQNLR